MFRARRDRLGLLFGRVLMCRLCGIRRLWLGLLGFLRGFFRRVEMCRRLLELVALC